jgi:hypothetical protein
LEQGQFRETREINGGGGIMSTKSPKHTIEKHTIECPECGTQFEVPIGVLKLPKHKYPDLPSSLCPGSDLSIPKIKDF